MVRWFVGALLVLWSNLGFAASREDLPPELAEWAGWVLAKHPELDCPEVAGVRACVWPGELGLAVNEAGGSFALDVHLDREARVELPGGAGAWPDGVTANGRAEAVLPDAAGVPGVTLPAGAHTIVGRYGWPSLPGSLRVPALVGRVSLVVNGTSVADPQRDADGTLRLGAGDQRAPDENRLDLDVSRKITDGVPVQVATRLALRASGRPREVNLGRVLLEGTRAVSLTAELPARLSPEGELVVQVRPGSFNLSIDALSEGPVSRLAAPTLADPWPEAEVWVVQQSDTIRAVTLSGAPAVDPARTPLAEDWRGLPTFLLSPGVALEMAELRRGEPVPPPNQLSLRRELWLDMDGGGWTARDSWSGTLRQGWRLEMPAPAALGHAADHGVDQVITTTAGGSGVELRQADVAMQAESRLPRATALPAVGWSADVIGLRTTLRLPPGWTLIAATGVDTVNGSLIDRWTLLDLFFVLVVSVAIGRLHGPRWGAVALVGLALSRQESGSPAAGWVALLIVGALERALAATRLALPLKLARGATVVAVLLVLLPFSLDQVRASFFPALERPWQSANQQSLGYAGDFNQVMPGGMDRNQEPMPAEAMNPDAGEGTSATLTGRGGSSKDEYWAEQKVEKKARKAVLSLQQDPKSVVQTGPGVPGWSWDEVELSWTGPVAADQELRLWLMGPLGNAALGLGQVLLLVALALRLSGLDRIRPPRATAPLAGLLLLGLMPLRAAAAPSPELLTELEARLTAPPACAPQCASVGAARLIVAGGALALEARVSAGAPTSWPVPGPTSAWVPERVLVDGRPTAAMARLSDGFLHVRLDEGVHVVRVEGRAPAASLTLQFGLVPQRLEVEASGWTVDGVRGDGAVEGALQLTATLDSPEGEAASGEALAPWLELRRTLDLGIPWRVRNELVRVGPGDRPLSLRVPLLPGEAVTEAGYEVKDGAVLVTLGAGEAGASWISTLAESPTLELTAPTGVPWTERWTLWCSPIFSCRADGPAPIQHTGESDDGPRWAPEWLPWPGETVRVDVARPEAVAGQTVTVDSVQLDTTPGARLSQSSLTLSIRTSQGGQQSVRLPEGAQLQEVRIDGQVRPIQLRDGVLPVPLRPGAQIVLVRWQQPSERWMGVRDTSPAVDLGSPAVNATVTLNGAESRWTLWLGGPRWGPKPLLWSFVLVTLGAAALLGRTTLAPLSTTSWALLGLGLTQVHPTQAAIVVGWFLALGWRGRRPLRDWGPFDLGQLALLVWTMVAAICLFDAVRRGLLQPPDMDIQGNASSDGQLVWYQDRIDGPLPRPTVLALPLMAWRVVMLAWALWLALQVVRWAPWAWRSFTAEGMWRWPPRVRPVAASAPRREAETATSPEPTDGSNT